MPAPVKTQAVVLRSIRYGEADRIVHLYPPMGGRVGAIAKGARRARSRFGGRLEPFFRLDLLLHEGRGELLTVTAAETVEGPRGRGGDPGPPDPRARGWARAPGPFGTGGAHPGALNLPSNKPRPLAPGPA